MDEKKRFYYSHSMVYGWCVYDRQTQTPAYDACAGLLPPVKQDESGTTMETPVMLENEFKAMKLCNRLNRAHSYSMSLRNRKSKAQ